MLLLLLTNTTEVMYHPSPHLSVYSDLPFQDPIRPTLLSFLLHFAIFHWSYVPPSMRPPPTSTTLSPSTVVIRNYIASTFHSLVAIIYILAWYYFYSPDLSSIPRGIGGGLQGTGDEWQSPILTFSLGYFLYDTVCMVVYPATASTTAFIHHLSIGSAFILGLYFDCCRPFHFLLLLEELSTPPLNLKALFKHKPHLSDAFALIFAISFLFIRMGYGMYVYYRAILQLTPFLRVASADERAMQLFCAFYQLAMCTASRLLNLYWSALIVRKVYKGVMGGGSHDTAKKMVKRLERQAATAGSSHTTNAVGDKME